MSEGVPLGCFDRHISVRYILNLTNGQDTTSMNLLCSVHVLCATESALFKHASYVCNYFISSSTKNHITL
jgi:hypothetical protein